MTKIQLDTQPDKYMISIDRSAIDRQWLVQLIERLRLEELAGQFDFGKTSKRSVSRAELTDPEISE